MHDHVVKTHKMKCLSHNQVHHSQTAQRFKMNVTGIVTFPSQETCKNIRVELVSYFQALYRLVRTEGMIFFPA